MAIRTPIPKPETPKILNPEGRIPKSWNLLSRI